MTDAWAHIVTEIPPIRANVAPRTDQALAELRDRLGDDIWWSRAALRGLIIGYGLGCAGRVEPDDVTTLGVLYGRYLDLEEHHVA